MDARNAANIWGKKKRKEKVDTLGLQIGMPSLWLLTSWDEWPVLYLLLLFAWWLLEFPVFKKCHIYFNMLFISHVYRSYLFYVVRHNYYTKMTYICIYILVKLSRRHLLSMKFSSILVGSLTFNLKVFKLVLTQEMKTFKCHILVLNLKKLKIQVPYSRCLSCSSHWTRNSMLAKIVCTL